MKKVRIVISKTNLSSFENMITTSKSNFDDKFSSNFVLVPDKFSLNAERSIFELLNINSTFNIDVVSFNRLAYKVFNKENLNVLSKRRGLVLINKIILENKDKLTTFGKVAKKNGLTENIYETIMQFKSSGILPSEVNTNDINSHLAGKLQDIKLVYNEYENYLNSGAIDEPHRLRMLSNRIKSSDLVKNSSFFIGMFDDFTYLQLNVIKELICYAKDVTISLSASTVDNNSDIYINENLQHIISLCKQFNYNYTIENLESKNINEIKHIQANLFAISKQPKIDTSKIKVVSFDDPKNEIEFVAKLIKAYVNLKGAKYSDFNIAVGDITSLALDIQSIFNQYGLPFYLDNSLSLSSSSFIKFVSYVFECYDSDFSRNKLLNLVKSPFIRENEEIKNQFENYIVKYDIDYDSIFNVFKYEKDKEFYSGIENFREKLANVLNMIKQLFNNEKFSYEFSDGMIDLLNFVEYDKTINDLLKLDLDVVVKKNLQTSFDKLISLMNDIDEIFDTKIDFKTYKEMLISMINSECFTNIPISTDCVYIADCSSYFYKNDFLFVINTTEGTIPNYKNDCGIITDSEIERLSSVNILSPSIKFINKKEKNRLFNLLTTFKDKLFITYSTSCMGTDKLPSEIVSQFNDMFNNVLLDNTQIYSYLTNEFDLASAEKIFVGNLQNAVKNNIKFKNEITKIDCLNNDNLYKRLSYKLDYNIKKNNQDKVSISKIEKYNKCPFYSYCQDVLKLKEKEVSGIKVVDIGTILHSVAELFGKYIIKNGVIGDEDLKQVAIKIYDEVLQNENYSHLKLNNLEYISLQNESVNLCKVILYQIKNSSYEISKLEYYFKDFKIEGLTLSGIIDRVDETDDYFNIIDYKTGKDKFSFGDIYTGKKLQLIVYAYIYERLSSKENSGFYYMPISNKYASNTSEFYKKYKLSGITLNNDGVIKRIDNKLIQANESDIINVKYTKSGDISKYCLNTLLSNQELVSLKEYAIEMLLQTYKELKSGNIIARPLSGSCDYCPYYSICGFNYLKQGERKQVTKVTKEFFEKEQK